MVKICCMPCCPNSSIKTPSKVFLSVPKGEIRKKWITDAARPKGQVSLQSGLVCYGDHFKVSLILEIKNLVVCNHCKKNFTE